MGFPEPESGSRKYSLTSRDDAARREYWSCLALRECRNIGMRRIAALLDHFGSAYDAVRALDSWPEAGVPKLCATSFKKEDWRQKARLAWEAAKNSPCGIVLWSDPEYPVWLRSIADPPPFMYFFGDIALLRNISVAVVGMRACSGEGVKATAHIARGLSRAGVTIVSGMAKGIDREAHLAGLEDAGSSIGVLGAGIDVIYPQANRDLYEAMCAKGLLLSEYQPAYGVEAKNFPVRNRIISGIARTVVVVEAALRSGSLNTANHALEQNRELMAVPGAVSSSSAKGCQELVRRGAKAVFEADDVLRELVPLLAEHVRQGLLDRDLERFRYPRPEPSFTFPGAVPLREPKATKIRTTADRESAPKRVTARVGEAIRPKNSVDPLERGVAVAHSTSPDLPALSDLEAKVYAMARNGPIHIDDICRALRQDAKTVSGVAAMLEISGHLTRFPGMYYGIR